MKINLLAFILIVVAFFGGYSIGESSGKEIGRIEQSEEIINAIENPSNGKVWVMTNTYSDQTKRYFKFEEVKKKEDTK